MVNNIMDYNLEVLTRKGFKNGKYDGRGMRYVKFDKCECGNDAKLDWFYEDGEYIECHACGTELCETCIIKISESDYRSYLNGSDFYEEWDDNVERIVCVICYHDMHIKQNRQGK